MSVDFLAGMQPPTFHPCAECKASTNASQPLCWECLKEQERKVHAGELAEETEFTIAPEYKWAWFDAPTLYDRVTPNGLISEARAALSAQQIVLMGPAGSGKTSLAVAILREWVRMHEKRGAFYDCYGLANARMLHGGLEKNGREPQMVHLAMTEALVVIDDFGSGSAVVNNPIPDIIVERHKNNLRTVITTGLKLEDIGRMYGGGVARRVFERSVVLKTGAAALRVVKS